MTSQPQHISVCICTYKRQHLLRRLLEELVRQETQGKFAFSIVVSDNDRLESAKALVLDFSSTSSVPVKYCVEPEQNIALTRNCALRNAKGDFIAFIDDDELPVKGWLLALYDCCTVTGADGVLGPVRPQFSDTAPHWVREAGLYTRPEHPTSHAMPWEECRTGNVLFRSRILTEVGQPFKPEFGTGSEDVDFFRRMTRAGFAFLWCNEAVVYEDVPDHRCKRTFLIKRALLRGRNSLRHPERRLRCLAKAVVAIPIYAIALPFLQLAGHHLFMKYLIKLCDHAGRLLAVLHIEPIRTREN